MAFYTFLSGLCNCLLIFFLLIILLREAQKFLGELLKIQGRCKVNPGEVCTSPQNPALQYGVTAKTVVKFNPD